MKSRKNITGPSSTLILIVASILHFFWQTTLSSSLPISETGRAFCSVALHVGGLLSVIGFVAFFYHLTHYGIVEKVINVLLILFTGSRVYDFVRFCVDLREFTYRLVPLCVALGLGALLLRRKMWGRRVALFLGVLFALVGLDFLGRMIGSSTRCMGLLLTGFGLGLSVYGIRTLIQDLKKPAQEKQTDPANPKDARRWAIASYVVLGIVGVMTVLFFAHPPKYRTGRDLYNLPPLHLAARQGNATEVARLIDEGTDINETEFMDGNTALHWSALKGHKEVLEILVNKGGNSKSLDRNQYSLLHYAAQEGRREMVAYLLEKRLDAKAKAESGDTPLHCVGQGGKDVGFLMRNGYVGEPKDSAQDTLMPSTESGDRKAIAGMLLDRGAEIEATNRYGYTPLHCAAMGGDKGVIEALLARGAKVNAKTSSQWIPLHYAALNGPVECIALLLEQGADIHAKADDGETPIVVASRSGRSDTFNYLLGKGGKLDGTMEGFTSLHLAATVGQVDVVKTILAKGIDIDARDEYGNTALQSAAYNMNKEMVQFLLESGADPNAKDNSGRTALHEVVKRESRNIGAEHVEIIKDIVRMLLDKGADRNIKDKDGKTPLDSIACGDQVKALLAPNNGQHGRP